MWMFVFLLEQTSVDDDASDTEVTEADMAAIRQYFDAEVDQPSVLFHVWYANEQSGTLFTKEIIIIIICFENVFFPR